MERDERGRDLRGREVRRRPPPGSRDADLEDRSRRVGWMRVLGVVVALAMLAPILIGVVSIVVDVVGD